MNYFVIFMFFILFDSALSFMSESYSLSIFLNESSLYKQYYNQYSINNKSRKNKKKNKNLIKFNTTNVINLKGTINAKTVNRFLYEFNLFPNKNNMYIFIDSPGGSVEDGYRIVTELLKYNVTCVVDKAYSMAFAILQTCQNRFLLPHGKIMQHQISLGIMNELGKIENYLSFISQIEEELLIIQSNKIGISSEELKNKSTNEWWLFGKNAVKEKCADKIVDAECTKQLTKETIIINNGMYDFIYSRCPLIPNYLDKVENNKNKKDFVFFI